MSHTCSLSSQNRGYFFLQSHRTLLLSISIPNPPNEMRRLLHDCPVVHYGINFLFLTLGIAYSPTIPDAHEGWSSDYMFGRQVWLVLISPSFRRAALILDVVTSSWSARGPAMQGRVVFNMQMGVKSVLFSQERRCRDGTKLRTVISTKPVPP